LRGRRGLQDQGVEAGAFPLVHPHPWAANLTAAAATFSFISTDPPAWAAAAAAMPSKFSYRQLRETGQGFESFLADRGLEKETDRERLRTIYNRDFKTRYGPAHPRPRSARGPRGAGGRDVVTPTPQSLVPRGSGGSTGSRASPRPARRCCTARCPGTAAQGPGCARARARGPRGWGQRSRAWGRGVAGRGGQALRALPAGAGFTGISPPWLRGCSLGDPLSVKAAEAQCRREKSRGDQSGLGEKA
jgi:hypothetical protein